SPSRPAAALCRPAAQPAHQPAGRVLERLHQAARADRHRPYGARRMLPLPDQRPERGPARGRGGRCARNRQGGEAMSKETRVYERYTASARLHHWVEAILIVCLALSGLSLFHPALFFLTGLFGGGQWTRILHPWMGTL